MRLEDGDEYVRLTRGMNSICIKITDGTVLGAPVRVTPHIPDFRNVPAQILTLDRLFTLWRLHKFRKKDFRLDQRRHRWLLALRAIDMAQAGFGQREIAEHILRATPDLHWNDQDGRLRSRIRRIIALGRDLRDGGYLRMLSGREEK